MATFESFLAALSQGVREAHAGSQTVSPVNGFTSTEHPTMPGVYKVEGESWTFYLQHGAHGWAILGWMEAGGNGLSF